MTQRNLILIHIKKSQFTAYFDFENQGKQKKSPVLALSIFSKYALYPYQN